MPVADWRHFKSVSLGLLIRAASFTVIFALLGMVVQMMVAAAPIFAPSTLERIDSPEGVGGALVSRTESQDADLTQSTYRVSKDGWQLKGSPGNPWLWVHDQTAVRLNARELPSDFSIAQMVGHQRGLAVLVGNTLEHFHFSQSTSINNVPALERVKTVLVGSDIVALAGHPRLAVVAFATSLSEIQVVDFRNPNASLRIQVDVEIDTIVWVSPSLIRALTPSGDALLFVFRATDIGGDWRRLLSPIEYEGYPSEEYLWLPLPSAQRAEPKYSVVPLIFGTLKAALLALLFSAPLSLGCAIYVGCFMSEAQRQRVRPAIDMLTAFPTVVLGAIGLFWLAPRFGEFLSALIGVIALFPILAILGVFVVRGLGWRWVRHDALDDWPLRLLPLVLLVIAAGAAAGLSGAARLPGGSLEAYLLSSGVSISYFNSLLVGIVLGLAITPTIFSIAEEAIHAVPRNLAAGALALGSTPWQGYRDVVLPLALPGMVAAIMVGFGRAAGETMILVMLSGNTGIMDLSIFEGLRSVSASLALELPEAPKTSSHYQVLFVMGLLLFGLTFIVNTVAEIIRARVRMRVRGL
ncbi:ABC transporter permease subunit [Luminiphilus sp.]|nr:ABC transporter permease subunit [Luminiphilus sp.]